MRSKALTSFIIVLLSGISWISTKDQFRKLFASLRMSHFLYGVQSLGLRLTRQVPTPHYQLFEESLLIRILLIIVR